MADSHIDWDAYLDQVAALVPEIDFRFLRVIEKLLKLLIIKDASSKAHL